MPEEFDEDGNAIRYRNDITLKKMPKPREHPNPDPVPADAPPKKLFDIGKLKLEKFHKVLHFIMYHCKGKKPNYV